MHTRKKRYDYDDLLACARGEMFGPGNAQLPMPPLLMFDRIAHISEDGGAHRRGSATAELDVKPDSWFFGCHFKNDPIMPGCLGIDALWQLLGFFLGWTGSPGRGRALGVGDIKFEAQILPDVKKVIYRVDLKRIVSGKITYGIADGLLSAYDSTAYTARNLRVGLFPAAAVAGPEPGKI